ncbi:MAG: chloride channel protein [Desulfurococcales archaeon]|nr:chloride channel protein [Desulfurococcales archaeon]
MPAKTGRGGCCRNIRWIKAAMGWTKLAYAEKWLALGFIVGALTGLFAYMFYWLLALVVWASARFLGLQAPHGEADLGAILALHQEVPLLTPVVILLGAALSSIIVYTYAPEAEGHGTDAAVRAYHRRAAIIPFKVAVVKALASALLVGSGGSGGVEGPSVQMGAGVGSSIARWLKLNFEDRRIALVAGMAAALSMLFQAPLGTAFFAVEVLYQRDMEAKAMIPAFIASITSYAISAPLFHYKVFLPTFHVEPQALFNPYAFASYIILGFYIAPFSYLYAKMFRSSERFFKSLERRGVPRKARPVLGAIGTAAIVMVAPFVAGSGRGVLAEALKGHHIPSLPAYKPGLYAALLLALAAIAKIAGTSLSVGSGGSGGVFSPGLLAGALAGLSFYHVMVAVDPRLVPLSPRLYAYLGMAALFGGAAKVPLATSVMVAEMGRNYLLIVPALIAAVLSRELTGKTSIYASQLDHRPPRIVVDAEGLLALLREEAHREAKVPLRALVDRSYVAVETGAPIERVIEVMENNKQRIIPIVSPDGKLRGVVTPEEIEYAVERSGANPSLPAWSLPIQVPPVLHMDDTVERALEEMVQRGTDYVIVVDDEGRYIGVVTVEEILAALAHLVVEAGLPRMRIKKR